MSDYVRRKEHSFAHLSERDREFLLAHGAIEVGFYAKSFVRKEKVGCLVDLYEYTNVFGERFNEAVYGNRIVIEQAMTVPSVAQAA